MQGRIRLKKVGNHGMIICEKKGGMMNSGNQADVKRKETLKAIETLSLLDDNLMTLVFDRNIEATELLLNVILQRDDLKVLEVVAQREYKNLLPDGRSLTIDILRWIRKIRFMTLRYSGHRQGRMFTGQGSIAA